MINQPLRTARTKKAEIVAMNGSGMVIEKRATANFGKTPLAFDLSNQPAGTYLIKVITDGTIEVKKVILQNK